MSEQIIERWQILQNSTGFRAALIRLVLARRALKWSSLEALGIKVGQDDL